MGSQSSTAAAMGFITRAYCATPKSDMVQLHAPVGNTCVNTMRLSPSASSTFVKGARMVIHTATRVGSEYGSRRSMLSVTFSLRVVLTCRSAHPLLHETNTPQITLHGGLMSCGRLAHCDTNTHTKVASE